MREGSGAQRHPRNFVEGCALPAVHRRIAQRTAMGLLQSEEACRNVCRHFLVHRALVEEAMGSKNRSNRRRVTCLEYILDLQFPDDKQGFQICSRIAPTLLSV